ncbi:LysM peptidoglycan-binding domain-containing protein [Streptomyces sp. NPDC005474]|uniref:LysM peptidoglycan-binding domain-containing protein n=1 Tax=Streptomyces sp. NPDC005474 TaxID=3154878 RepID=UPI003451C1D4
MEITGLATALKALERGTTLPVSAAQAQSGLSGGIASLISTYLAGNLLVTGIAPQDVRPTSVVYTGSVEFLGRTLPATATFWLTPGPASGTPELTLALALPAGWTFAATYPPLAGTDVGTLAFTSPAWVLESADSDGSGGYADMTRGLNFSGTLVAGDSPALSEVAWLLSADLHLYGALTNWSDPQATAPTTTLRTAFGDTDTVLGAVTLATRLRATVGYVTFPPEPPALTAVDTAAESGDDDGDDGPLLVAEIAILGQVGIDSGSEAATLSLTMPVTPDPALLTLSLDGHQALDSLAALAGVAGGTALGNLVPAQFPLTRLLRLDDFVLVVAPRTRRLVSLSMGVSLLPSQPAPTAGPATKTIEGEVVGSAEEHVDPVDEPAPLTPFPARLVHEASAVSVPHALTADGDDPPPPVTWVIIPPDLLAISDVQVRFQINDPSHPSASTIATRIGGTFWIADVYPISLEVLLPGVTVNGYLLPGYTIPVPELLEHYGFDLPPGFDLDITDLLMSANPGYRTFDLSTTIDGDVTLISLNEGAISLTLTGISAELSLSQTGFSCQFIGQADFAGVVDFALLARKEADSASGWTFGGSITHPFSVGELISKVTGWTSVPGFLNDMQVTEFDVAYHTGSKEFSLETGLRWLFADAGVEIDLGFSLASTAADGTPSQARYHGSLTGGFTFLGMELELVYAFDQLRKTSTYDLKFGELAVSYANPDARGKRVLHIDFGNVTLGDILSYLVRLADPAASPSLDGPWSALGSISLSNLSVQVNFTDNVIEVDYAAKVDLGFISLDNIGLRYSRDFGQGRVDVLLQGEFLGQKYGQDRPLGWNAVGGQPPAVPGAGSKVLDLRYLGIGQHVTLDATGLTMVKAVIDAMRKTVVPLSDTAKNPLDQVGGLRFDSGANWMFGASFTLLETFTVNAVFLDPVVYGLRIDVAGPQAEIFQGLSFEILYRKVTDTVGVYHLELQLPDAMRHLEFGEVSVTLPVVVLDIYTNGNFRVDFGFPPNLLDWSRSLAVEVFPFVGYGGFYFALLDGSTSTRLPAIDNGRFAPDIEFGFALSVGVGKTLSIGPLSAGVSVTVAGMVQGALAWFHPDDASTPSALYYWLQGTVAVVGHVYGTVDFAIVKASLDLTVYASITLTVEAYQPIVIHMQAGVEVRLNVKILFITLHFSFSATISLTFTLGSASTPPWHIAPAGSRDARMRAQLGLHRPTPSLAQRGVRHAALPLLRPAPRFDAALLRAPAARAVAAPAEPPITLWLTPVVSQAEPTDFLPAAPGQAPVVAVNFLLFIENAIDPGATDAAAVAAPVGDAADKPYNRLAGKLLRWALGALGGDFGTVTADELAHLHTQLDDPDVFAQWFSYPSVTAFLADQQVVFEIEPRPADAGGGDRSGSFFPMFPDLSLALGTGPAVSFWDTHPVDADYVHALTAYFQQLMVDYENSVQSDPAGTGTGARSPRTLLTDGDAPESMAGWLFGAYFGMLTKSVVQNAIDHLKAAPYRVTGSATTSLASIAASFPTVSAEYVVRAADTPGSVHALLGRFGAGLAGGPADADATPVPGTRLAAEIAVSPVAVVTANQSAQGLLGGGRPLLLPEVTYQVAAGDGRPGQSIDDVARAFSFTGTPATTALAVMAANADRADILLTGATFALPTLTYQGRGGDTVDNVARYFQVPASAVTQSAMTFTVTGVTHTVRGGFVITYTWKQGDTLDGVIDAFFAPSADDLPGYEAMMRTWNATADFTALTPGAVLRIPLTESLAGLARYYFPGTAADHRLAALQPAVSPAPVLAPLATLTLADVVYPPQPADTFAGVAQRFNLTLDELTGQIASQTGILTDGATVTVPDVPAMTVDALVAAVQASPAVNTGAASTSHFLLHGLRVPYPTPTMSPAYPLYSLTGQQVALGSGPAPSATLGFAAGHEGASWITFAGGSASLPFTFTAEEQRLISAFATRRPDPAVSWLGPLPLSSYQPTRFSLQNPTHWQAAALPAGFSHPGQSVAEPTLWPLPHALLERTASATGPALRYDLATATHLDAASGLQVAPVASHTWATAVPLTLQQLTGPDGSPLTGSYLMAGTDDVGKQRLFDLLAHLSGDGRADSATVLVLYPPDPSGRGGKGLASDQLDTAGTWVLKTNLSTLSHSGPVAPRADAAALAATAATAAGPPTCLATIDRPADFLTLIWEASVVRTGGFYLEYANTGGTGLPGHLFGQGPTADVTLLVLLGSQLESTMTGLLPFNNMVVVGDNIDASDTDLFVQPSVHTVVPGDTLTTAGTASPAALALANQTMPGLLFPGRTLLLGPARPYEIQAGDTFAGIARAHPGTSVTGIAQASARLDILVPGVTVRFFGTGGHLARAGDTLAVIARALTPYNMSPAALALANQTLPGLLQPGRTLSLDGSADYRIGHGDTFASIARAHPGTSVTGIATASAGRPVLTPGAPMQLAGRQVYVTGADDTLAHAADVIGLPGVDAAALGTANQDNLALLQPGRTLLIAADVTYRIQAGDTLAGIARQFSPATPGSIAKASARLAVLASNAFVHHGTDQLQAQAAVPPGNTGFQLWRGDPGAGDPDQQRLDELFGLVGFGIEGGTYFGAGNQGLPTGPTRHPGTLPTQGAHAPASDDGGRYYQQVVSLYQSAKPAYNTVPATPALPAPSGNPYAGIHADPASGAYSQVRLGLGLHDLSGNLTSGAALGLDPIRVGHTDRLVGLSQWPSVTTSFDVPSDVAELRITAEFRAARYVPGFGQSYRSSHDSARSHLARYTTVYYQLQEPGLLQFAVTSSIGRVDSSVTTRQEVQLGLLGLVEQILLFLGAAENLAPVCPPIAAGTPLATVASTYAVTVGDIVVANKDAELADRLVAAGTTLAIPTYHVFTTGTTVSDLLTHVTLAQLGDRANLVLPLEAGTELIVPVQHATVDARRDDAFNQIARLLRTTVADLASNNGAVALNPGGSAMTFALGSARLPVGPSDTLTTMASGFNALDPSLAATPLAVAMANDTVNGVFAGLPITWNHYVVHPGDTLGGVAARFTGGRLDSLLGAAGDVVDLLPAGTAVYLSGQDASYPLRSGDTFATVAATYGISLDALAGRNTGLRLLAVNQGSDDAPFAIPDLVEFPVAQQPRHSVHLARGGSETIADIIARFPGWDAVGFLALDAELPGLFAPAPLPGTSVLPTLTDTVTSLAARLGVTPSAFVNTFRAQPGVLRAGAAVLVPAARTGQGMTITTAAQPYPGVTPAALAEANAALRGVLAARQRLTYAYRPDNGNPVTRTYDTGVNDTFLTVTAAFNALFGLSTLTVADVVAQNPQAALAAGQPLLVPPAPAALPPLATTLLADYPDPIFPLTVELRMLRDPNRVAPELLSDSATFVDVTPVPPSPLADGSTASLDGFAERFEKTFAGLKLGTGEDADSAPTTTAKSRLWVVNFDAARGGIEYRVEAPAAGGFFAVRPLSTEPWTRVNVPVPAYTPGQPLEWTARKSFTGADLDAWLATLLASVDRLLSPQFALPASRLGAAAQALLADVLTSKGVIADGLAGLVEHLLSTPSGDRDQAAETLRQQLLTTLSSLYDTTLLVQFPVTVTSPYTDADTAPSLSGKPIVKPVVTPSGSPEAPASGNATRATHTLSAGDTLTSIAARLGVTVVDLVAANDNVADVFAPTTVAVVIGSTLTSVPVVAGDTPRTVAGKIFHQDPTPDQLAEFAAALWSCDVTGGSGGAHYQLHTDPPAPAQPTVLSYVELLPVTSFSTGKVPLVGGSSSVTVLVDVRDPLRRRMAYLDLDFAMTQLEYDVQLPEPFGATSVVGDYRESSWLSFLRPVDAVPLGQVQTPIPLRAHPGVPVLSTQSATPSHPGDPDLARAKEWDYAFTLAYQAAAQDSIELGMFFNRLTDAPPAPPTDVGTGEARLPAVHVALAQFNEVAAAVEDDLRLLLTDPADPRVLPALQAFRDLVQRVDHAWSGRSAFAAAAIGDEGEAHWYRVDPLVDEQQPDEFSYLALTAADADPLWPTIDGAAPGLRVGAQALYAHRQPISSPLDLEVALRELDAVEYQNGWSGVSVVRNENLLGGTGPADATNPLFVYRTPLSLFSSKVTPSLLADTPAPLTARGGVDLATALGDFFGVLFDLGSAPPSATFQVKVAARYAYSLTTAARPGGTITPAVPLVLVPLYAFDTATDADPASPTSFVSRLAAAVTSAAGTTGAATVPGTYLFDVGVYSSLSPEGTQGTLPSKPLLDIRNRSYPGAT